MRGKALLLNRRFPPGNILISVAKQKINTCRFLLSGMLLSHQRSSSSFHNTSVGWQVFYKNIFFVFNSFRNVLSHQRRRNSILHNCQVPDGKHNNRRMLLDGSDAPGNFPEAPCLMSSIPLPKKDFGKTPTPKSTTNPRA